MRDQFRDVYREHVAPVWRYVRARLPADVDAEDVTSDVFVRAAHSWPRYEPARGTARAWLLGIARHAVADWWRQRTHEVPIDELGLEGTASDDPESAAIRAQAVDELRRHLGSLTPKERDAVALRFGAGLSAAEAGAALGVTEVATRMLVYRAVGKLRRAMLRSEGDAGE